MKVLTSSAEGAADGSQGQAALRAAPGSGSVQDYALKGRQASSNIAAVLNQLK
ncbi:MAG TPA: hypothetical protein VFH01_02265 [Pyrinomonadaceae bacterium]|nr:hypothetical protein [Pyrinomonadaceae bacterium]